MFVAHAQPTSSDCDTQGYPIVYEEEHIVTVAQDTTLTPLVAVAPDGVMENFQVQNNSCAPLTITLELYSVNSDCDGCTTDIPQTKTVTVTVPPGQAAMYPGRWVDYSIDAGIILQDGEILVQGYRVTSTCCTLMGLTTTTNALIVPTA